VIRLYKLVIKKFYNHSLLQTYNKLITLCGINVQLMQ